MNLLGAAPGVILVKVSHVFCVTHGNVLYQRRYNETNQVEFPLQLILGLASGASCGKCGRAVSRSRDPFGQSEKRPDCMGIEIN